MVPLFVNFVKRRGDRRPQTGVCNHESIEQIFRDVEEFTQGDG